LGIGVWALGIVDWSQSTIPNPQSPIPNPHVEILFPIKYKISNLILIYLILIFNYLFNFISKADAIQQNFD